MTSHYIRYCAPAGLASLAWAPNAMAQAITYQPQVAAVPTLGQWGLILLSALLLVGAYFFFRNAKNGAGKVMSVFTALFAVGMLGTNHDVISQAWANGVKAASFDPGKTVVELDQGPGPYTVTNPGPNSIRVTGFTGDGDSCVDNLGRLEQPIRVAQLNGGGFYWRICPHGFGECPSEPLPGCTIGSIVPSGGTCHVTLSCVPIFNGGPEDV